MKRLAAAVDDEGQWGKPGEVPQQGGAHIGDGDAVGFKSSDQWCEIRVALPVPALLGEVELDDEILARSDCGEGMLGNPPILSESISPNHRRRHNEGLAGQAAAPLTATPCGKLV